LELHKQHLKNEIRDYYLTALEVGNGNISKVAEAENGIYYVPAVKEWVNKQFGTPYMSLVSPDLLTNSNQ
jgi:hypothetical protein